jgi:hypothetical protein
VEKGILDVFGQFQDGRQDRISSRNDNGPAGGGGGATMAAAEVEAETDGIKLLADGVVETALLAPPGCPVKRS